jgi:hypothetical protein
MVAGTILVPNLHFGLFPATKVRPNPKLEPRTVIFSPPAILVENAGFVAKT